MREIVELLYSLLTPLFDFNTLDKTKMQKVKDAFVGLIIFFLCISILIIGLILINK